MKNIMLKDTKVFNMNKKYHVYFGNEDKRNCFVNSKDTREKRFTSTPNKLLNHIRTIESIKHNHYYPINLQIAPTNKCNMACKFCSVRDRPNDELNFNELMNTIIKMKKLGLKAIEITGGGDPTLYPSINHLISLNKAFFLDIGMITNGIALDRIETENLQKLTWLRISLSMLDFNIDYEYNIPDLGNCDLGFSYVWHKDSKIEIIDRVYELAKKHNAKYVRLVPDCLSQEIQEYVRTELAAKIKELGYDDKIFIQAKPYDVYTPCRIGAFKPFLNADGYLYQCSAVPLYNRKFEPEWRICHMSEVGSVWPDGFKPFNSEICKKGKCFYSEQNKLLDEMTIEVEHNGFI